MNKVQNLNRFSYSLKVSILNLLVSLVYDKESTSSAVVSVVVIGVALVN